MSSTSTGFPEEQRRTVAPAQLGVDYIPTIDERRVLKECNQESFFYRSVPFSVIGMAVTQALVSRGTLSASPRFGSLPKVAFAGFCGYLAGKMSYMKTCQEKFKRLENSPLGEILRQRSGMPPHVSGAAQSELSDPDSQSFGTMFQAAEAPGSVSSSKDYGYSLDPPEQMGRMDDFSAPVQSYVDEEEPQRKSVLYEDLRLKNRENYEVTLIQKADTMIKTSQKEEPARPNKQVKKNVYGDAWEE
ncbi:OCIA domain-containing protein 1-like isoform X2 [Oryzias melastigma]|uniref:OCIA domain-containing protein 1 n=1 Tax=Oryzias melastigma TaxID=30732 RepID=A0A3B3C932_ORYME|nr:OCIA domain-containing protein 1-like isoform X2 [Oryzias melastigma]